MIEMSFSTFMVKVLVFINIYLLSFSRLEDDTHIKCSSIMIAHLCLQIKIKINYILLYEIKYLQSKQFYIIIYMDGGILL